MTDPTDQWNKIREREDERRGKIGELRKAIEQEKTTKKKSSKNLFHLVIKSEGLKASNASNSLGVSIEIINKWIQILESKGLVETEGLKTDLLIKPSQKVQDKLELYRNKKSGKNFKQALGTSIEDLQNKKKELLEEHKKRLELEAKEKAQQKKIQELEQSIQHEKDLREGLQERMKSLETQIAGGEDSQIQQLKEQVEREHEERVKVEELLKKEHERAKIEVDKLQKDFEEKQKKLIEREHDIIAHEKSIEEDEELDILFGDETVEEEFRVTELKIGEIEEKLSKEEEKLKEGIKPSIEELEEIIEEEEDVAQLLKDELKRVKKEKTLENLVDEMGEKDDANTEIPESPVEDNQLDEILGEDTPEEEVETPKEESLIEKLIREEEEAKKTQTNTTIKQKPIPEDEPDNSDEFTQLNPQEKPELTEELNVEEPKTDLEEIRQTETQKYPITPQEPAISSPELDQTKKEVIEVTEKPKEEEPKATLEGFKPGDEPSIIDFIRLLQIVDEIPFDKAVKKLRIDESKLQEWIQELVQKQVITADKKILGGKKIRVTGKVDLKELKEVIEAQKIRDELRKLREQ